MITNYETTNVLNAQIMGLSTDTKPTTGVQPNSLFWELDTNGMYFFDGTEWQAIGEGGGGGGGSVTVINTAKDAEMHIILDITTGELIEKLKSVDVWVSRGAGAYGHTFMQKIVFWTDSYFGPGDKQYRFLLFNYTGTTNEYISEVYVSASLDDKPVML